MIYDLIKLAIVCVYYVSGNINKRGASLISIQLLARQGQSILKQPTIFKNNITQSNIIIPWSICSEIIKIDNKTIV